MRIRVVVDGLVKYEDRTFKIDEALDLVKIAITEGVVPSGKITSVMLISEVANQPVEAKQIIEDAVVIDGELDSSDSFEEKPAVEVFSEGRACAV